MTDKERIQAVLSENEDLNSVAFHCPDIQTMKRLVKALYALGFYWAPGTEYEDRVVEQRWNEKKKNTGIVIGNLKYDDPNVLWHGRVKMYENQGRKIIEVPDLFAAVDANDNANTETSNTSQETQTSPKCQNDTLDDTLESSEENKASLQAEQTRTTKKCPQCGNEMPIKAKFCNRCGHAFAKDEKTLTDDSVAQVKNDNNVSQKQNETENQKQVNDAIATEPVVPAKPEKTQTEQSEQSSKRVREANYRDEPVASDSDKAVTSQRREEPRKKKEASDDLPLLCQLLNVGMNEPFCFLDAAYFSNCVYRINEHGLREIQVGSDFWLPCQNEGELVYLLQSPQNIKVVKP